MKKLYTLIIATGFCASGLLAQASFSDDFESYTAGGYLAGQSSDWTTWNNKPGTTEDVKISDADAHSGQNSIYFSSNSADGGPSDVIKKFGVLSPQANLA